MDWPPCRPSSTGSRFLGRMRGTTSLRGGRLVFSIPGDRASSASSPQQPASARQQQQDPLLRGSPADASLGLTRGRVPPGPGVGEEERRDAPPRPVRGGAQGQDDGADGGRTELHWRQNSPHPPIYRTANDLHKVPRVSIISIGPWHRSGQGSNLDCFCLEMMFFDISFGGHLIM